MTGLPQDEPGQVEPGQVEPGQDEPEQLPGGVRAAVEAVLMVADDPVTETDLAEVLQLGLDEVAALVADLAREYRQDQRGFALRRVGAGWRITARADLAPVVARFVADAGAPRLSRAALETLAVIAYRQPVTRGRVAAVRGVDVDGVVRTLLSRGLVAETGRDEESGALLYGTTAIFLEKMGLTSTGDLPPLAPFLPADSEVHDLEDDLSSGLRS